MQLRVALTAFAAAVGATMLAACGVVTGLSDDYQFTDDAAAPDAATTGADGSSGGTTDGAPGVPGEVGCSDGTREAFADRVAFPRIAGCAGGWEVAGVEFDKTKDPACNRRGGNDGQYPSGSDGDVKCNVTDLCAEGWHVCAGGADVTSHGGSPCDPGPKDTFWITRTVTNGDEDACMPAGALNNSLDNVVGCGTLGRNISAPSCGPLNRYMRDSDCSNSQPWECSDSSTEAAVVRKRGPGGGGVLCCKSGA